MDRNEEAGSDPSRQVGALGQGQAPVRIARHRYAHTAILDQDVPKLSRKGECQLLFGRASRQSACARVDAAVARIDEDDRPSRDPRLADRDIANRLTKRNRDATLPGLTKPCVIVVGRRIAAARRNKQQERRTNAATDIGPTHERRLSEMSPLRRKPCVVSIATPHVRC
jgi:hypothetical protein